MRIKITSNTTEQVTRLPWFQRFIFIIFIAKGRGKINLWLKEHRGKTSAHASTLPVIVLRT